MSWRNTKQAWGWLTISIHWITALVVVGLFALGLWMVELTYYDSWYRTAPFIHKSIGVLLFLLTLFRILWKLFNVHPQPLDSHSLLEKKLAAPVHGLIYLLLFAVMLSGYLISTADGRAVEVFNLFQVPATLHGLEQQEDIAGDVHLVLAISLMVLVSIHALAALKHHFVDKDLTLKRMLGIGKF